MLEDIGISENIKFMCVVRLVPDKIIVASYPKNSLEYTNAVEKVINSPDLSNKLTPGVRYRLTGDINAFNFLVDAKLRLYIVITVKSYPERIVFQMINELINQFLQDYSVTSLTCASNGIKCNKLFQKFFEKFDNPDDKLTEVIVLLNGAKKKMGENIDMALENVDQLKEIEKSTEILVDQSAKFYTDAKVLRRRELCKQYKTIACIVFSILLLLTVILLVAIKK